MSQGGSTDRPPPIRLDGAPEVDPETGDYIFRFPIAPPADVPEGDLFRWVVEEQLRALLGLVELAEKGQPIQVTGYRFLHERTFRNLYPPDGSE